MLLGHLRVMRFQHCVLSRTDTFLHQRTSVLSQQQRCVLSQLSCLHRRRLSRLNRRRDGCRPPAGSYKVFCCDRIGVFSCLSSRRLSCLNLPVSIEDAYPVSTEDRTVAGRRQAAIKSSVATGWMSQEQDRCLLLQDRCLLLRRTSVRG